jgi:hypothetical protein
VAIKQEPSQDMADIPAQFTPGVLQQLLQKRAVKTTKPTTTAVVTADAAVQTKSEPIEPQQQPPGVRREQLRTLHTKKRQRSPPKNMWKKPAPGTFVLDHRCN